MSEKLMCPCCGSALIDSRYMAHNCKECGLKWSWWNESKHQLPKLTPETIWNAYCRHAFKNFPKVEVIQIKEEFGKFSVRGYWNDAQCNTWLTGDMVVEFLGWRHMPPITRKDGN